MRKKSSIQKEAWRERYSLPNIPYRMRKKSSIQKEASRERYGLPNIPYRKKKSQGHFIKGHF